MKDLREGPLLISCLDEILRRFVSLMKERAAEDKSLKFFIRDGQVQSVQRDQGLGEREERKTTLRVEFIRLIFYHFQS